MTVNLRLLKKRMKKEPLKYFGLSGDDQIHVGFGAHKIEFDGGDGIDTVHSQLSESEIDLENPRSDWNNIGKFNNVENFRLNKGDDFIRLSSKENNQKAYGGGGNDTMIAGATRTIYTEKLVTT